MRTLTTTLFVGFLSAWSSAQEIPPMHMGPRFGLGLATQSVGGFFKNTDDLMPAPVVGWHFEFPFHAQMSFMPEVLWMSKGFVVRNQAQNTRTRATFRYIEVPLFVRIHMEKSKYDEGLYLLFGPSMGYYLSGRSRTWLQNDLISDTEYTLPSDGRRFEFSGTIGLGKDWTRWSADVRAQSSFAPFSELLNVRNVVYALVMGYRLTPGKKA